MPNKAPNKTCTTVYFVVGQGGSGTRLVTRLLISAGCYGSGGHAQSLDEFAEGIRPTPESIIIHRHGETWPNGFVFRRSYPDHGGMVPDLARLRNKFRDAGCYVVWVVVLRRPGRFDFTQEGTEKIFSVINLTGDKWCFFDTSLLFIDPARSKHELGMLLGLDIRSNEEILNPDDRLFTGRYAEEETHS